MTLIEELVDKYGGKYRRLIVSALQFLDENEPKWGLDTPINKRKFIQELVKKAIPYEREIEIHDHNS